jgi:hypothetical protein
MNPITSHEMAEFNERAGPLFGLSGMALLVPSKIPGNVVH